MNERPDNTLTDLLIGYLDGELTADEQRQLAALIDDDAARRRFVETCYLVGLLAETATDELQRVQGSGFGVQERKSAIRNPQFAIGLAALIALAATAWFLFTPNPQPPAPSPSTATSSPVALLSDLSPDAVFAAPGSDRPMTVGADLPPGPIRLTAGRAQIMFSSTAVVDLTGPCEFEMTGPNSGKLTRGWLDASVRPEAVGFTIDLPGGLRVVDLGTEFGVHVDAADNVWVKVLKGAVELTAARVVDPVFRAVRIDAGHGVSVTHNGQTVHWLEPVDFARAAHYPLDDSQGPTLNLHGASGRIVGAVERGVEGARGHAYRFHGGGVRLGDAPAVRPTGAFTVTFCFNADSFHTYARILDASNNGVIEYGWRIMTDSIDDTRPPRLCLLLIGDSGRRITTYSSPVAPGRWYFVAARYDPNTNARLTVLSLDGRRADTIDAATIARNTNSTDTASGSIHYATGDGQVTRLGLSPSESAHQWAYRGRLDEVVFYNQSLTNEQLARLVAAWIDPGRADSHVPITSRIKEKEAHP